MTQAEASPVLCPLCDYDLRGLAEPQCPECGYRFTWDELTDPRRRAHPYAFEHHPERNAWSFRKTCSAGSGPGSSGARSSPRSPRGHGG